MNLQDYQSYLLPIAIVVFFFWRWSKFKRVKSEMPQLISEGALVVDVRSVSEFSQGSRPGSLNIPLNEIGSRLQEIDKAKTIILCCASGSRSAMAAGILKQNGFSKVVNAGPWSNTLT
jgi:phage shock protein E